MKNIKIVIIIAVIIFCIGIFVYLNNNIIQISEYTVNSTKISDEFNNFKIVHLSDLHNTSFGKDNVKLTNKIKKINPDIIVITGDMISSRDTNYEAFINLIKQIQEYEMYYVYGNHEQDNKKNIINDMTYELEKYNVNVLDNEMSEIVKGETKINIYGLTYPLRYYQDSRSKYNIKLTVDDIEKIIGKCDANEYNILLTHNPLYYELYEKWGADLVFSGHVHGGIMRLPVLGGVLSPDVSFFPKYSKGIYSINNSNLIVSAGLGIGRLPVRVFNLPHIPVVTFINIDN